MHIHDTYHRHGWIRLREGTLHVSLTYLSGTMRHPEAAG